MTLKTVMMLMMTQMKKKLLLHIYFDLTLMLRVGHNVLFFHEKRGLEVQIFLTFPNSL